METIIQLSKHLSATFLSVDWLINRSSNTDCLLESNSSIIMLFVEDLKDQKYG